MTSKDVATFRDEDAGVDVGMFEFETSTSQIDDMDFLHFHGHHGPQFFVDDDALAPMVTPSVDLLQVSLQHELEEPQFNGQPRSAVHNEHKEIQSIEIVADMEAFLPSRIPTPEPFSSPSSFEDDDTHVDLSNMDFIQHRTNDHLLVSRSPTPSPVRPHFQFPTIHTPSDLGFQSQWQGCRPSNPVAVEARVYYNRNMRFLMQFVETNVYDEIHKEVEKHYKKFTTNGKNKHRLFWDKYVAPILSKFQSKFVRIAFMGRTNGLTPVVVRQFYSFVIYLVYFCAGEQQLILLEACDVLIAVAENDPLLKQFPHDQ